VELLVTMVILAILGTAILGASRVAMEGARKTRTKTTITKLHTLLMERYESYQTRRVEVKQTLLNKVENDFRSGTINAAQRGQILADLQLLGRRELMKLEMPDRWSDVLLAAVPNSDPLGEVNQAFNATPPAYSPFILQNRPALSNVYLRRLESAAQMNNDGTILRQHQGAECLYMIIMLATGDGEARTLFSQQDIGDVDGDGAPEFLDGWKQPIEFLRWPAGFVSDLQPVDAMGNRNPDADHDPFDPFRRDQRGATQPLYTVYPPPADFFIKTLRLRNNSQGISAYRLLPLIYSAGPDGDLDIEVAPGNTTGLDPYERLKDASGQVLELLGTQRDNDNDGDNSLDNIHNHLMDNK